MGIIIKQSVRGAFWSYLGIAVGYVNVGIIMPQFFDTDQIGLVQIFIAVSLIFSQFATLGFPSVINRMFPAFRNPSSHHHGFLFLLFLTAIAGFSFSGVAFFLLKPWIIETNAEKSPLFIHYLYWLLPLIFMRLLFTLLDNYNKVLYDAVTGTFWLEFMHKVINLFLIILFAVGWINFHLFFLGYLLSMSIPVVPVIFVLARRKEFHMRPAFRYLTPPLKREMGTVMFFGLVNGFSGILLMNVDKIFVNQFLSLDEVGIFGVCALFATLIRVPYNSISKIATGIIAESWSRNDIRHIQEIYQKSALNQAIAGTLIFVGILVNLDNIFEILPPVYSSGRQVMVIYSAGMLVVTTLGLASNITETSSLFRFTTLFLAIAIVLQFVLSFLLIPRYGITGAALATMITLVVNILFQAGLQRIYHGIAGVNRKLFKVAMIGIVAYLAGYLVPGLPLIPDILARSLLVILIFGSLIIMSKLSPDLNGLIPVFFNRIKSVFQGSPPDINAK
jgi:O-antigen/teichoic acid export membrane protein